LVNGYRAAPSVALEQIGEVEFLNCLFNCDSVGVSSNFYLWTKLKQEIFYPPVVYSDVTSITFLNCSVGSECPGKKDGLFFNVYF
jgi:hypothetical protein